MLDRLDSISDRTAYLFAALGLGVSLVAAFMAPQEAQLGAWVRLVIWHGMLKWACIVGIFGMGALAVAYLVTGRDRLYEWARAHAGGAAAALGRSRCSSAPWPRG